MDVVGWSARPFDAHASTNVKVKSHASLDLKCPSPVSQISLAKLYYWWRTRRSGSSRTAAEITNFIRAVRNYYSQLTREDHVGREA
jgi:hypothetical protein